MSSGEKILSVIREDSEKTIEEIKSQSKDKCSSIIEKAKAKADEIISNAEKKKAEQTEKLTKASKSRIELEKRNILLKAKRKEIDKAVDAVLVYMSELEDKQYFELIYKFASTLGNKEGIVFLGERDIKRVPEDFEKKLSESGIKATLSMIPDKSIKTGFILKNGDIEDNMSFESVIAEKREAVEDLINRELFKD